MTSTMSRPAEVVQAVTRPRPGPAFAAAPTRTIPSLFLARLCKRTRSVCITFDDGPGARLTGDLLALLDAHAARATFFVIGSQAGKSPEIVDQIAARSHEIGCHTLQHRNAWKTRGSDAVKDIRAGYHALSHWIPTNAIFRPPYGKMSLATMRETRRRNASVAWWTIDGGDTHSSLPRKDDAVERLKRLRGGVVLLHDFDRTVHAVARARYVVETTESLLRTAAEEGLVVRTIAELIAMEGASA